MTLQSVPNGDGTSTLSISFADDKPGKCGTTWDTQIAAFALNATQEPLNCPFNGIDGTGLEGWGNRQISLKPLLGYTSNGYYKSVSGDLHWTSTVCVGEVKYIEGTSPPVYQLQSLDADGTDDCLWGCCVWAQVDRGYALGPIGYFQETDTGRVGTCPTTMANATVMFPWTIGDPSLDQPSPQLTSTPTASETPSQTATATQTSTPTATVAASPTASLTASNYPTIPAAPPGVAGLSAGALGGIVAGTGVGALFAGFAAAGTFYYRRSQAAAPDRAALLPARGYGGTAGAA